MNKYLLCTHACIYTQYKCDCCNKWNKPDTEKQVLYIFFYTESEFKCTHKYRLCNKNDTILGEGKALNDGNYRK